MMSILTNVNGTNHSVSGYSDPATGIVYQFNVQRLGFTALKPLWAHSTLKYGNMKFVQIINCNPLFL
jgi:hypothetical protein